MKREERHATEVGKLQEQVNQSAKIQELLTEELESTVLAKSKADKQLETAQNALKERALQDQKLKTKCDEDAAQRKKAESDLAELRSQSAEWLNELKLINRQMTRKFSRVSKPSSRLEFVTELLTLLASCRGVRPNRGGSLRGGKG